MSVAAAIIGGIIGAGGSIAGGLLQNSAMEKAANEARTLSERERQDTLRQQRFSNEMALNTLDFQKEQAQLNRQDSKQQSAYNQMADQRNFLQNLINSDDNLKLAVANLKYSRRV